METMYDVAIVGAGVTGMAAACLLAHDELRVAVLEKAEDVGFGVSKANSGIVHGGFHYPAGKTLKGKLELRGNLLFDSWSRDYGFPFHQCGILVVAFAPEQMPEVQRLWQQGKENGVPGIELCDAARLRELEPKLAESACGGLYAPGGGVVEPYLMVFALAEAARQNGVEILTRFEVVSGKEEGDAWLLTGADGRTVRAAYVVNAAGLYADKISAACGAEKFRITPRKGEEYLLDRLSPARPSKVVFPVPTAHTKGVLVIPTAGGTTMIGPTAELVSDREDRATTERNKELIFTLAANMVQGISPRDLIASFSGSRPVIEGYEDFYIARSHVVPRFIQAAGILSPGLTSAPAIAEWIAELLQSAGLVRKKKKTPFRLPEKHPVFRELSLQEAHSLHEQDPGWTNIVCRCEKVSEAEIRAAVRRGHRTVDGVKLATRAGMGRCQGGFCTRKILHIISEETGLPPEEILKGSPGSFLLGGRLGEESGAEK